MPASLCAQPSPMTGRSADRTRRDSGIGSATLLTSTTPPGRSGFHARGARIRGHRNMTLMFEFQQPEREQPRATSAANSRPADLMRHDWRADEVQALYDAPLLELVF